MRVGTLSLKIMGNILMITGNLAMTCVGGGGGGGGPVFKMDAGNIVCTTTWIKMNGCNVKLPLSGFNLIELTPKLSEYGIKVS